MFDLTAGTVDRPFRDKHAGPTVFSIIAHAVVIGSVVGAFLFTVTENLPKVPSIMAFVAELPAAPPPPPPPPSTVRAPKSQAARPAPAPGQMTLMAPADVPEGIRAESELVQENEGGVEGGVEGGIPGGVVGGVVGGIVSDAPAPPPPSKPLPIRVGGDIQAPTLIHRVEPLYPAIALHGKVTGTVILEATVDESGRVTGVNVLRSIILLDKAATEAVQQWRYQPLLINGIPFPFVLTVTLTFSIR